MLKGPVIRALGIGWKETCREFSAAQVIIQAIATYPFSRAWLVTAIAFLLVSFLLAFHR